MIEPGKWYPFEIRKIGLDGNMEVDYDQIQQAITQGVLAAQRIAEEHKQEQQKSEHKQIIKTRLNNLGLAEDFDEQGNPRSKKANAKFVWKFLWAKEKQLKDIHILSEMVNGIVAFVFGLIEWFLYILAASFMGQGIFAIVNCCRAETFNWAGVPPIVDFACYGVISFLFARTFIRLMKIECKHNKDSNYMLNLLAVVIAIVALLVSIFKKS